MFPFLFVCLFVYPTISDSFLRRVVGSSMTPSSISKLLPQLQETATEHVNRMLESCSSSSSTSTVVGEDIFHDFTLDVAGRIILGLNLTKEEEVTFKEQMDIWLGGLLSFNTLFLPGSASKGPHLLATLCLHR